MHATHKTQDNVMQLCVALNHTTDSLNSQHQFRSISIPFAVMCWLFAYTCCGPLIFFGYRCIAVLLLFLFCSPYSSVFVFVSHFSALLCVKMIIILRYCEKARNGYRRRETVAEWESVRSMCSFAAPNQIITVIFQVFIYSYQDWCV